MFSHGAFISLWAVLSVIFLLLLLCCIFHIIFPLLPALPFCCLCSVVAGGWHVYHGLFPYWLLRYSFYMLLVSHLAVSCVSLLCSFSDILQYFLCIVRFRHFLLLLMSLFLSHCSPLSTSSSSSGACCSVLFFVLRLIFFCSE